MDFNINNTVYHLMDSIERIPSKDSFTHRENKLGSGSGAWEWHVGSKNDVHRYQFFGGQDFNIRCFLKKSDLIWLMNELRFEYQNPSQNYRQRALFNQIWQERYDEVNNINDEAFVYENKTNTKDKITANYLQIK